MRPKRELAADCWYYANTAVNNGEPCRSSGRVLSEARLLFAFELRGVPGLRYRSLSSLRTGCNCRRL
jgi:hypothetical protein